MSSPSAQPDTAITDHRELAAYLEAGSKPSKDWRIGTEHEKFGFRLDDLRPLTYEGPQGIEAVLRGLTRFDWDPIEEDGKLIALSRPENSRGEACCNSAVGMASVTLEPAGQLELSGAPLETIHDTCCEAACHLKEVKAISEELGIGFLGMGFQPKWKREEMPWMPKGRYGIMRRYMPTVGNLGLDMMTRTCTVQVNLDFADEADMVKKFRVSLALQPIATALFADSPFTDGKPNGYLSYRSHIWTDTDPDRTGMLDFVFEDGFGYERYVDYLLDVPMYFSCRDGVYVDAVDRGLGLGQTGEDGHGLGLDRRRQFHRVDDGDDVGEMAMGRLFRHAHVDQRGRQRAAHDGLGADVPAVGRHVQLVHQVDQVRDGPARVDQAAQEDVAGDARRHVEVGDHLRAAPPAG